MGVAKQLYQLQEIDLEVESKGQALSQVTSQLGESQAVVRARGQLVLEQQRLEEFRRQQQSIEWEIDDISNKITTAEEKLYSGRITNPKELLNLQHEVEGLKSKRNQLEDRVLEIMDQVELTQASVVTINSELKRLEAEWHSQQQQLSAEAEQLKAILSDLEHKRQLLTAQVDSQAVELYQGLKKQKRTAVAKVEQGICRGCQISLPITELQLARSGSLVQCSSCARVLFLA